MPDFDPDKNEVRPLRKRTMTLSKLQMRTLDMIRMVRFQLRRAAHEDGLSDEEFIESTLEPFEHEIYADRQVLKMIRQQRKESKDA